MSIAAITGSTSQLCAIQNQYQQLHSQLKQLGQDLQAGDLTQAQSDFVTLSQAATSQLGGSTPIAQALKNVGTALQSGDLSAAQQAFQMVARGRASAVSHSSQVPPMGKKISQGLDQLSQALQSGNLSAAQQAFASVQELWQQVSGKELTPINSTT